MTKKLELPKNRLSVQILEAKNLFDLKLYTEDKLCSKKYSVVRIKYLI